MKLRFTPLFMVLPTLLFASVTVACDAHNDVVVSVNVGENAPENKSKALTRKIYLDPETQEFRPANQRDLASEQLKSIEIEQSQSPKKSTESVGLSRVGVASAPQQMSDGSLKIDFNGQFDRPLNVSITPSGAVETGHHLHAPSESTDSEDNH